MIENQSWSPRKNTLRHQRTRTSTIIIRKKKVNTITSITTLIKHNVDVYHPAWCTMNTTLLVFDGSVIAQLKSFATLVIAETIYYRNVSWSYSSFTRLLITTKLSTLTNVLWYQKHLTKTVKLIYPLSRPIIQIFETTETPSQKPNKGVCQKLRDHNKENTASQSPMSPKPPKIHLQSSSATAGLASFKDHAWKLYGSPNRKLSS